MERTKLPRRHLSGVMAVAATHIQVAASFLKKRCAARIVRKPSQGRQPVAHGARTCEKNTHCIAPLPGLAQLTSRITATVLQPLVTGKGLELLTLGRDPLDPLDPLDSDQQIEERERRRDNEDEARQDHSLLQPKAKFNLESGSARNDVAPAQRSLVGLGYASSLEKPETVFNGTEVIGTQFRLQYGAT